MMPNTWGSRGRCRVKGFDLVSKSRSSWLRFSVIRSAATPRARLTRGNRLGLSGSAGRTLCRPGRFETSTRYRQPPQVEGSAPFRIFAMRADRARPRMWVIPRAPTVPVVALRDGAGRHRAPGRARPATGRAFRTASLLLPVVLLPIDHVADDPTGGISTQRNR